MKIINAANCMQLPLQYVVINTDRFEVYFKLLVHMYT